MLTVKYSSRFKKDVKLLAKRGKDLQKLYSVIDLLRNEISLPAQFRDHTLVGNYVGFHECHIESDWLLIYLIDGSEMLLTLSRTGTHSDLLNL